MSGGGTWRRSQRGTISGQDVEVVGARRAIGRRWWGMHIM